MSSNSEFENSNWIDEAIAKKLIKYYKFEHFHNIEEIGCGGFGNVYRANWKNSHKYLALKSFFSFSDVTIKAIVHEVLNYNVKNFPFIIIIFKVSDIKF